MVRIIKPEFLFEDTFDGMQLIKSIERYGRTCYKSEKNITDTSAQQFVRKIISNGHESVLEHEKITVRIICDRGVSHEIVRHRIASYSQESTRYCNYSQNAFGGELTFIEPCFWNEPADVKKRILWEQAVQYAEKTYLTLLQNGATPEEARSVLPNSLKTEIVVTMNLREWRHFFLLRASVRAHPQMREIALKMLEQFKIRIPVVFDDL